MRTTSADLQVRTFKCGAAVSANERMSACPNISRVWQDPSKDARPSHPPRDPSLACVLHCTAPRWFGVAGSRGSTADRIPACLVTNNEQDRSPASPQARRGLSQRRRSRLQWREVTVLGELTWRSVTGQYGSTLT